MKIAKEISPLFLAQWRDWSLKDKVPFGIDWDRAFLNDLQGLLHILTVRYDSKLVGYVINVVVNPVMHSLTKWALVEALYLDPLYREGWVGYNMLKKNEKGMKLLGCDVVRIGCPVGSFERILKRLKYDIGEVIGFKFL